MKKLLVCFMTFLALVACSKSDGEEEFENQSGTTPSITLTKNEYVVASAGETIAVEVKSNVNVEVELPSNVSWISENKSYTMSTNIYYFVVAENQEYDQREANIKFTNKENKLAETVKVVQMQKDAIVLAKNEYTLEKDACHLDFDIQANVDFEVKVEVEWIKQVQSRGLNSHSLYFDVSENIADDEREGKIVISSGNIKQEIKVIQKGREVDEETIKANLFSVRNSISSMKSSDWDTLKGEIQTWLNSQSFVREYSFKENDYENVLEVRYNNDIQHNIVFFNEIDEEQIINSRSSWNNNEYFIPFVEGENIIPEKELRILCFKTISAYYKSSDNEAFYATYSTSPVKLEWNELKYDNLAAEKMDSFSEYGVILITQTHGGEHFCITAADDVNNPSYNYNIKYLKKKMNLSKDSEFFKCFPVTDLYWFYGKTYAYAIQVSPLYLLNYVTLKNNGIIFGAYCYSGINNWMNYQGNFIGTKSWSFAFENKLDVKDYFDSLFNGKTHEEAFQLAYKNNYLIDDNLVTNNKNPKQRYFSITTKDVDSSQNFPVIEGQINGYGNLKKEVVYKIYYDSQEFASPSQAKYSIEVTPDKTGNINTPMDKLESLSSYYYCIGMEYEGKYYYGDVKSFTTIGRPITLDATEIKSTSAVLNAKVGGWKNLIAKFGFCYSKDNETPDVNTGKIHGEIIRSTEEVDTMFNSTVLDYLEPGTTYYYRAYIYLYNNGQYIYGDVKSFTTTKEEATDVAEAIDLGLSVKWASHNVGATKPEEYGGYYAWGETEEKEEYTLRNYKFYNLMTGDFTDIGTEISGTEYDVARIKWGGNWRMPTANEITELYNSCEWVDTTYNNAKGKKIIGPNGNYIFLPAAGLGAPASDTFKPGEYGCYWSGTKDVTVDVGWAHYIYFDRGVLIMGGDINWGATIRPVTPK